MKLVVTSAFKKAFLVILCIGALLSGNQTFSQANSVRTGVTFTWSDTQATINDPATIRSVEINGDVYSTFVVPTTYELTRLGPGGHDGNHILQNGSQIIGSSNDPSWNTLAIDAYQSLNLNHYFESQSNGDNFCNNYGAIITTNTQIQTITYAPGIPCNPDGILAVTERGGNNCFYIEVWGIPVGGGPEQQLGQTFVRNETNLVGVLPPAPPTANSDYWSSGRNNDSGQIIGVALYQLSELAPVGSTITSIRYYAATNDNGDGKFFLMQTYAQDDSFNPDFNEVFNGDAGANDNVPVGSTYSYYTSANPLNGTVVVNTDGTFTYTPNPGFTGTDSFEIQVCLPAPNQSVCDTSIVTLNVKSGVVIDDAVADEGDDLTYTIGINDPLNKDVAFDITYTNNSTTNSDYSGPSTVILPANTSSISFDVQAIDDSLIEPTETFTVTIVDASNTVTIIDANANGTINDNDGNEGWPDDMTLEACDTIPSPANITSTSTCAIAVDLNETIEGQDDECATEYTITRVWTITDCVGNVRTHSQVITIEDTIAPTFVETLPIDITVSCDNIPEATVLTAVDSCEPDMVVDFEETITGQDGSCPNEYTMVRTWTVSDCAGNSTSHTQTIIVADTEAPNFVEELPESMTVLCNEVPDVVTLTATDNCDPNIEVAFDEVITNDANCIDGYTITRTWSTSDCAGNTVSHTQVITIAPTGPIMASPFEEEVTILCDDELPEVPDLTFTGGCGNYDVVFNEETEFSNDTDDYMVIRTWDVTDSCGNIASFQQIIFVLQPQLEEVFIDICVEDEPIDLLNYLPVGFDRNGTFESELDTIFLNHTTFVPYGLETGEYKVMYSSTEGTCKYYVDFYITVNKDCVPCNRDEIKVSEAVTVNGDGINDFFEIKGVEYCGFTFDVMIFNRWGDKVFEAKDYQNDWGGFAPSNAVGNSGLLPAGTYYYVLNINGSGFEPLNGYIYLGTE